METATAKGEIIVKFMKDGVVIPKRFDSMYRCRKFVEKAKRSKRIMLISYPLFD